MADYTFPPAPVLVEETGEFAIGAIGVLRATEGGDPVSVYDLNDSPLPNIVVGPKGAHQAFKADIPDGVLDFGSVLLPTQSLEAARAGLTALDTANDALAAAEAAAVTANDAVAAANDAVANGNTKLSRQLTKTTITAAYTLVAGDAIDRVLHSTSAAGVTVTLPQDSAVDIAQDIPIPWRQYDAGVMTFAAGTGATVISRDNAFKSAGLGAEGAVTKIAPNTWLVSGDVTV